MVTNMISFAKKMVIANIKNKKYIKSLLIELLMGLSVLLPLVSLTCFCLYGELPMVFK